jgi:hypothetical protein
VTDDAFYLLDNNVVSHLSLQKLESAFFRERCNIPSEVLHEANGHRAMELLRAVEYRTTSYVLAALSEVLATVSPSDTSLIDLYADKGNADPLLIACALLETRKAELVLVKPLWFVVSNDKPVLAKAAVLGVAALSREEFLAAADHEWAA